VERHGDGWTHVLTSVELAPAPLSLQKPTYVNYVVITYPQIFYFVRIESRSCSIIHAWTRR